MQFYEVGDISYFNYEDSINIIRPYHSDRIKIITIVFIFIINEIIKFIKNFTN